MLSYLHMRKKKTLRIIALFLAVQTLFTTLLPTISYALTSGPTAPEVTSFEPVDTTDLVNLQTGDFTYNIPLLEVPGPAGGYPLSLSYHAGIMPEEEASWVGLGWTLNPGAINRSVNGFADDNYNVRRKVQNHWDGGEMITRTTSVGLSHNATGAALSVHYVTSEDTYRGVSASSNTNLSIDPMKAAGFGINSLAKSNTLAGGLLMAGGMALNTTAGASISSKGVQGYASVGKQKFENANVNRNIASRGVNLSTLNIPFNLFGLPVQVGIKKDYLRYWSDATSGLKTFGALYPKNANRYIDADGLREGELDQYGFDAYQLYSMSDNTESDPLRQKGGSLPAYDRYTVLGQGIGGEIRPYIFENGDMYQQNVYAHYDSKDYRNGMLNFNDPIIKYQTSSSFSKQKVDFRFINDFSNKLLIKPASLDPETFTTTKFPTSTNPEGFDNKKENQHLAGSKHIEWFSNQEINSGDAKKKGFLDYYKDGERKVTYDIIEDYLQPEMALPSYCVNYVNHVPNGASAGSFINDSYPTRHEKGNVLEYDWTRFDYDNCTRPYFKGIRAKSIDISRKIGGFMVTNTSGITYHYALPVYAYNEYTRNKVKDPEKGASTFREYKNDDPYAYTWLLTAVTGPDYVDRSGDGMSDDDFGYWVKFDYGLWTDSYQWRTPHTGFQSDIEEEVEVFSYGIKELYYLDAIETKTHKAFFIKSLRRDGRGITSRLEGGSNPRKFDIPIHGYDGSTGSLNFRVSPVGTLKLDEIYLMDKNNLLPTDFNKDKGTKYLEGNIAKPFNYSYTGNNINNADGGFPEVPKNREEVFKDGEELLVKYHNGNLILDDDDISESKEKIKSRALKIIEFKSDYSLGNGNGTDGVPNSFAHVNELPKEYFVCNDYDGTDVVSPLRHPYKYCQVSDFCELLKFGHDIGFYQREPVLNYTNRDNTCPEAADNFIGNELLYYHLGKLTLKAVKVLGKGGADILPPIKFSYEDTENPIYSQNKVDMWNYYKSDYEDFDGTGATKRTTPASGNKKDAWSLSSITTSIGSTIQIKYESDSYSAAVLNPNTVLSVSDLVPSAVEENKVMVFFSEKGLDIKDYFNVGEKLDLKYLIIDQVVLSGCAINGRSVLTESNMGRSRRRVARYETDIEIKELVKSKFDKDDKSLFGSGKPCLIVESPGLYKALSKRNEKRTCGQRAEIPAEITPYFISGFAETTKKSTTYGDGIRVKEIKLSDSFTGESFTTNYNYSNPQSGKSSGVTAYEPFIQTNLKYPGREDTINPDNEDEKIDGIGGVYLYVKADNGSIGIFGGESTNGIPYDMEELEKIRIAFQLEINKPFRKILALANELPGPGVLYEYVTVKRTSNNEVYPSYSVFNFQVFKEDFVSLVETSSQNINTDGGASNIGKKELRNISIKNFNSLIGGLLGHTVFNSKDDSKISEESTLFLHDKKEMSKYEEALVAFDNQGVIQQAFHDNKLVKEVDDSYTQKGVVVHKSEYPSVPIESVTTNYKTGIVTSSRNLSFDFYSGEVIKTLTSDSYGNFYVSETEPAYRKYEGMGLKVHDSDNKHMLSQAAVTSIYNVEDDQNYKPQWLLAASVQTWSDQTEVLNEETQEGIWRKKASYQWNGLEDLNKDGSSPYNDYDSNLFNFGDLGKNYKWEKTGEITLYGTYSHALEAIDINGNYGASRLNPAQTKVIASASNVAYNEFAYSGAEFISGNNEDEGGVKRGDGHASTARSHTGSYSLEVPFNSNGFNVILKSSNAVLTKRYKASVWVYLPGESETTDQIANAQLYYKVDGKEYEVHPQLRKSKSKNWYLLELNIDPKGAGEVFIGCRNRTSRSVYFDDFRLHPIDGSMSSYVYDQKSGELNYILDGNNIYTHFEYNAMGQLIRSSREQLNFNYGEGKESFRADQVLNEVIYHYRGGKN